MLTIQRPGHSPLEIDFILIDFEGTLALDRRVHPKAKDKINLLSKRAKIYVLAKAEKEVIDTVLKKVNAEIVCLKEGEASTGKLELLEQSGANRAVVIGNGTDDASLLEMAGLGMCVIGKEGAAAETISKADVVFTDILDALDFLLKFLRQKAALGR